MRTAPLCVVLAVTFISGTVHAQLTVSDPALTAATESGMLENAAKLSEQLQQLQQQVSQAQQLLEQTKGQYQALTGSRNLGQIMDNPAFRDYLPPDWQGVYDSVRTGGYSGLSGSARSIATTNQVYDVCAQVGLDPDPQRAQEAVAACQASVASSAQDKAMALEAFDRAKARLAQIQDLMHAINQTKDPKAIAELQARIAAEQAAILNEQTKLQMFQLAAQAEKDLQAQREREIEARRWASRKGMGHVEPLTFK
jgi:type IV secretion system protein VirB5